MKIIEPSFKIESALDGVSALKHIELCGRVCYKSEHKLTEDSYKTFVKFLIDNGHTSVLEHYSFTIRFICDRGVSHEMVRHRHTGYSQESTRYCNYTMDKFGNEITVIRPYFFKNNSLRFDLWEDACRMSEVAYFALLNDGATPQEARSVLPNSTKTELVVTTTFREWRDIFKLRTSPAAHPQMREIMIPALKAAQEMFPIVFDDIEVKDYVS
jgi:thymidylate synthase (FAD)